MLITNNHDSFHLWWHENFVKHQNVSKYYDQDCRYLALFDTKEYEALYNRITYLISRKNGITYIFSHYFAKIKFDSYDSLPIEKRLTSHYFIITIKSVRNKDKNDYYYKIFLEKWSYQLAKK